MSSTNSVPYNVQDAQLAQRIQVLTQLEEKFIKDPAKLAQFQQKGLDAENDFADLLRTEYAAQFGSMSTQQVVNLINNYPDLISQAAGLNLEITAGQDVVNNYVSKVTQQISPDPSQLDQNIGNLIQLRNSLPDNTPEDTTQKNVIQFELHQIETAINSGDPAQVATAVQAFHNGLYNVWIPEWGADALTGYIQTFGDDSTIWTLTTQYNSAVGNLPGLLSQLAFVNQQISLFDVLSPAELQLIFSFQNIIP